MNFVQEVEYYCKQENTSGALLVNGDWGIGKTYFFEKILPQLPWFYSNASIISISLFGITSREILDKKLKEKYILKNISIPEVSQGKKGLLLNTKYALTKFLTEADVKLTEKEVSLKSLFGAAQAFAGAWDNLVQIPPMEDNKKIILIFDDLERCPMDMEELLGAINAYVEGNEIKTILITNEDYILKKRSAKKTYLIMKEKLVCRTVRYEPDFEVIVRELIDNYKTNDENYIGFLKSQKDSLVGFLKKHKNLRILKSTIYDFEQFYEIAVSENIDKRCYSNIFLDYLSIVTEFIQKETDDTDKDAINYSICPFKQNAMKVWKGKGIWDPNMFRHQLFIYKVKLPELVILRSNNLLELNDQIWEDGIDKLLNIIYQGTLAADAYPQFLRFLINACKLGIDINLNVSKLSDALKEKLDYFKSGKSNDMFLSEVKFDCEDKKLLEHHFPNIVPIFDMIEQLDSNAYQDRTRNIHVQELQDDNHDTVQNNIGTYPSILNQKLANAIGDYWNRLHERGARNNFMEKFISSFEDTEKFADLEQTLNGIDTLIELLSKPTTGPISTAQNKEFKKRLSKEKEILEELFYTNTHSINQ